MNLSYNVSKLNDQILLKLTGELDSFNRNNLSKEIDQIIQESNTPLTIDLSQLNFIDSIGLGLIATSAKKLHQQQRDLTLLKAQPHVKKLIEGSGLLAVLEDHLQLID